MAWKHYNIDDMRLYLSEDEIQALDNMSKSDDISAIINSQLDDVVDAFRGAWESKGYALDTREHYCAPEYKMFVMNIARYQSWTRFNMSPAVGLDEARTKEYEKYLELMKNPYIGTSKPEWEYSSENPDNPEASTQKGGSISIPFLRMDESLYYWAAKKTYDKNCQL